MMSENICQDQMLHNIALYLESLDVWDDVDHRSTLDFGLGQISENEQTRTRSRCVFAKEPATFIQSA